MSAGVAVDVHGQDQLARITRLVAETQRFVAERSKALAVADKLRWDRLIAPLLATVAILGAVLGTIAAMTPPVLWNWGMH